MNGQRIVDGALDFSGGVDSGKVATVASELNPNGLRRDQLAWLINGTVRGGGISQRMGWLPLVTSLHAGNATWQGGYMYEPADGSNPYLVCSIGGVIYKVLLETPYTVTNLSVANGGLVHPAGGTKAFFCQAEEYLVIQAGDFTSLPLFWDGATLTQSAGFVGVGNAGNQIPPAGAMDYYMGRLWYAGYPGPRDYGAGDIVGASTASVLKCTENPIIIGGDGFKVPDNAGNIRALKHSANLNTALGQGQLFIFTRKAVYSLDVPVTREDWIAADSNNQPLQRVVQLKYGATSDRSIVPVNGDLFYQAMEPSIRSLNVAVRYFEQWGNVPISSNVDRLLGFNDRELLQYASGIEFDNRLIQTAMPEQAAAGVVHKALVALDFDTISSLDTKRPPAWEGVSEGLQFFQLFTGDFGGRERAFGVVLSTVDGSIQVWELTDYSRTDNADNRVTWVIEFPAYTGGKEFTMKELEGGEIWVDRLYGTVDYKLEFRPDGDPCWHTWHNWQLCTARNSAEDLVSPVSYPTTEYCESYRAMTAFPKPPHTCASNGVRPINKGYQFQCKLTITGWCRVRGFVLYMRELGKEAYQGMICNSSIQGGSV